MIEGISAYIHKNQNENFSHLKNAQEVRSGWVIKLDRVEDGLYDTSAVPDNAVFKINISEYGGDGIGYTVCGTKGQAMVPFYIPRPENEVANEHHVKFAIKYGIWIAARADGYSRIVELNAKPIPEIKRVQLERIEIFEGDIHDLELECPEYARAAQVALEIARTEERTGPGYYETPKVA